MSTEATRAFLLALPHTSETLQWGDNLVFWVAPKSIGGKMFALIDLTPGSQGFHGVIAFPTTAEGFAELTEREGVRPAPYLARAHWVSLERWSAMPTRELHQRLMDAHTLTLGKLPRKTRVSLGLEPLPRTRTR